MNRTSLIKTGIIAALIVLAAFAIGAAPRADLPAGVDPQHWIRLSDSAGLKTLASRPGQTVTVELYVKSGSQWVRGFIQNPVQGRLIDQP